MKKEKKDNISFSSYISPSNIICGINAVNRNEAIMEILKILAYNKGIGNVPTIFDAIIEREEGFSTVIAKGIAIPHVRLNTIDDLMIGIATSKSGIIFTDKEPPVHIIILLLTPKEKPSLHLQVLSSLSKIILKDNIIDSIIAMNDSEDIWKFFNRENLNFPDYICAGDIMSPDPISLSEFQNLAEAIDLIVRKNISDVPVIDKEGDLVGVVTAYELLKVCLPDYILWIDDLSPIINFEPFTHILQNESNTWLAEIMSFDYAVVDEKDPAITVAKEITKHKSNQAYVLRDKKLVGVISIERFVNKIFRE